MTCIVALVDKESNRVVMGGDSSAVANEFTMARKDPKVFKNGDFLIGICGSFRMGDLLEHSLDVEPPEDGVYDRAYMTTTFVDAVRLCLLDGGMAEVDNAVETGGAFLVGVGGTLYTVEEDYQVGEYTCDYISIGCGDNWAMGALYAMEQISDDITQKNRKLTPENKVTLALQAASNFSGWVCEPFHVLST